MFLDPDPRRAKRDDASGFFSSQKPIASPRDWRTASWRKQPLAERTSSQNNQQRPWSDPKYPTVRLVKISPQQPADNDAKGEDSLAKGNTHGDEVSPTLDFVKPASASNQDEPGLAASELAKSVSDSGSATNKVTTIGGPDTYSLLYTTDTHVHSSIQAGPRRVWHRRSGSTGNDSTASTLLPGDESAYTLRSDTRLSQGTTLRGTPTPTEQELRQRIEAEEPTGRASFQALETLPEASPERSTLRAVAAPSEDSESVADQSSEPPTSPIVQTFPASTASPDTVHSVRVRRRSWRAQSTGSPRTSEYNRSSTVESGYIPTGPTLSSPNYVAYTSSPARARSGTYPLRSPYSFESIQSRLQSPAFARPDTARSLVTSSSWASFAPGESTDTLPPLQVPKKRLRHKSGSNSLNAAANTSGRSMDDDEIDILPYPREQFSRHLSTIASESERTNSRQLSHFSLGSGVLTGDDSSSIPLSGTWPRRRRESAPVSSVVSDATRTSGEQEPGDMTLGIFREESAMPQPLQLGAGSAFADKRYDGPLPPLPPIPRSRDSVEGTDRVPDLQAPQLREKRSGYSLRHRSNSTPSRSLSRHVSQISRSDTDRWSQASSLFPVWAKNFYGHGAALLSPSKVSLAPPATPRRANGNGHDRNNSQWTERSITSRLGTGYSKIDSTSLTSSHFLPSIFRPRTRGRTNGSKHRKSKRGRPSDISTRPDSLQIFEDPAPGAEAGNTLPSGHPKYGSLKDGSQPHRPLPRKYSKQKQWDEMQFPRPMTKDRLSDFRLDMEGPHLAPTNRTSRRFSVWRPPSFVESLDTLVRSRGNRQILLFALGFVCPLLWMLGAVLPIPEKPVKVTNLQKALGGSEDDVQAAMMKHEAGDAERKWREDKAWQKARWWRMLNRVMSVVGVLVIGAVIALAVIATR